MTDELIDIIEPIHPGPMGDITPEARKALAEMRSLHGSTTALQDQAIAGRINDSGSLTRAALDVFTGADRTHAVFIGDSITFGQGASSQSNRWSTLLCAWFGLVEHNYAIGGTGWIAGNDQSRFDGQCRSAAADKSYDHAKVKYVFMFGGVNDGQRMDAVEHARTCVGILREAFPGARIITGVGLQGPLKTDGTWGQLPLNLRLNCYRATASALQGMGVACVSDCWRWIYTRYDLCVADALHPNDDGHRTIAGLVAQIVQGVYSDPTVADKQPTFQLVTGPSTGNPGLGIDVGLDRVNVYGTITYTMADDDPAVGKTDADLLMFTLPDWCRQTYTNYCAPVACTWVDGVNFGWFAYLTFSSKGNVNLHISGRDIRNTADPGPYHFRSGDKITILIDITLPIWGFGKK